MRLLPRSSLKIDLHPVDPKLEVKTLGCRDHIDDDTALVLHGGTGTAAGNCGPRSKTRIVAVKVLKFFQIINFARQLRAGDTDVTGGKATDAERLFLPLIGQHSVPPQIADPRRNGLASYFNRPVHLFGDAYECPAH